MGNSAATRLRAMVSDDGAAIVCKDSTTREMCRDILAAAALLDSFQNALTCIANFADPYEISEDLEEFGGTDDGLETVCMAYENMQSIARATLRSNPDDPR